MDRRLADGRWRLRGRCAASSPRSRRSGPGWHCRSQTADDRGTDRSAGVHRFPGRGAVHPRGAGKGRSARRRVIVQERQPDELLAKSRERRDFFVPAHVNFARRPHPPWGIPCSRDNSVFRWIYDTEIVGDLIAIGAPVPWDAGAQEGQHRDAEVLKRGVVLVVGDVSVNQSP